jgi:protease PrsW
MDRFAIVSVSIAPGLLVLAYGVTKTRSSWKNEALWTAFLLGALGTIGALLIELAAGWLVDAASLAPLTKAAVIATFVAALPEEAIKYFILVGAAERHVDARRRQDIIALAIAVSLGFATAENFVFVVTPANWGSVAAARALTAVPGHGIDGLAMGALLTAARLTPARRAWWAALALIVPAIMHAAYDFPLLVLKSPVARGSVGAWFVALWPAVQLAESILAVGLCNWILPMARRQDQRSGRDTADDIAPVLIMAVGGAFLIAVVAVAILLAVFNTAMFFKVGIAFGIVPLALAADLVWTGWRQRAVEARPTIAAANSRLGS